MKKKDLVSMLTAYMPTTPYVFVYMLQQVEYNGTEFIKWVNRAPDFRNVIKRKKLVLTNKAKLLLVAAYGLELMLLAFVVLLFKRGVFSFAVGIFLAIPAILILFLAYCNRLGTVLLAYKRRTDYRLAKEKLTAHKAVKIAVLGSYGKTTTKELLTTVLSQNKTVAATPGNKNVPISHARWINTKLNGDEDILIFEFGESRSGDIAELAELIGPDYAVVAGYAPNHLETYGSVEALKADLSSIEKFVKPENLYVVEQAAVSIPFTVKPHVYSVEGCDGWKTKNIEVSLAGTSFDINNGKEKLHLHSSLIGEHIVAVLSLCFALGLKFGLSKQDIEKGIERTVPFEHRMQASFVNGAWLIDDTYNGNLEGIRAGLTLLKKVDAARKIYVTPGLVEQGAENEAVHAEIGKLIAEAKPDVTVLMQNSVRALVEASLKKHGYKGVLRIEEDPLHFYKNIQYELAAGDVVMMQNDWTDNYA